jgi:para-nitrobenzyl esterase
LGLKTNQIDKLQQLPAQQLIDAVNRLPPIERPSGIMVGPTGAIMAFAPVVDGHYLPAHPFDPVAAPTAADVPLIIGCNRDEAALFLAADPRRRRLEESELRERLAPRFGDSMEGLLSIYKKTRPDATPWDLLIGISSEGFRLASIRLAERKAAGGTAPTYMYLFTWQSDYLGYLFKSCHALEIPFVFDNTGGVPLVGERPDKP